MYRIAHISDLHFQHPDTHNESRNFLQNLLSKIANQEVVADHHDEDKLAALRIALNYLRPDLIIVTGDLTNFGDTESFALALDELESLKNFCGAERVVCVPGNHDSLCDRAAALREGSLAEGVLLNLLAAFSPQIDMSKRLAPSKPRAPRGRILTLLSGLFGSRDSGNNGANFEDAEEARKELEEGANFPFLRSYLKMTHDKLDVADPSTPIYVKTNWGEIAIFLFNSTNDSLLMCNEGRIGRGQYNRLNAYYLDRRNETRLAKAVRIGVLHHHPISAPTRVEGAVSRGFDTMRDGTEFISYVNGKFHLILHGHQHAAYKATVRYDADEALNLVGAGSAIAGGLERPSSFNVIDLISPFQGRVQRFDYEGNGYDPKRPDFESELEISSFRHVRRSRPDTPLTSEDIALRNLVSGDLKAIDGDHQYELLAFDVSVSRELLYHARYRRKGRVVQGNGRRSDLGLRFLITGSPAMPVTKMKLKAQDAQQRELQYEVEVDHPNQKMILVLHRTPLSSGEEFDITLDFEWQASVHEPPEYDGINLNYFKFPVNLLTYSVVVPWEPIRYEIIQYDVEASNVKPQKLGDVDPHPERIDDGWRWCFKITKPPALAHLIAYPPKI
jgi:3',5'-cyclic AMP phosphodiesterase CpdA